MANFNPITGLPIKGGGINGKQYNVPSPTALFGQYQPNMDTPYNVDKPNYASDYWSAQSGGVFNVDQPNYSSNFYSNPQAQMNTGRGIPNLPYGSAILGAVQLPFAIKAMRDANRAVLPQYQNNPYLLKSMAEADAMRGQGFTGSEMSAYKQQLGNQSQNAYLQGIRLSGGQLSNALNAILKGHNTDSINQLAVADANLRRSNMGRSDQLSSQVQQVDNMNTQLDVDQYNRKQQAAAQLMQASLGNLTNPMNYLGGVI